jgi:hypothetical protein
MHDMKWQQEFGPLGSLIRKQFFTILCDSTESDILHVKPVDAPLGELHYSLSPFPHTTLLLGEHHEIMASAGP